MVRALRLCETEVRSDSIKQRETSPSIVKDSNLDRNPVDADLTPELFTITGFLNL